jgi:alkaline phosphatase D
MVDHGSRNSDGDDGGDNTTPSPTTKVTSRIAFGSCHKSKLSATPPIWETILPPGHSEDVKLDAWLWLGDAMYPSHRDPITRKKYYGPAPPEDVETGLRAMKHENATIGYKDFLVRLEAANADTERPLVTGVWDDHDFGGNDMGSRMPSKQARRRIYRSFLGHPPASETRKPWSNPDRHRENDGDKNDSDSHEGLYHRVDLENGKIRILVLDTRWFREDHCIPSVAQSIPKGNAVACLTRWLTSVRREIFVFAGLPL